MINYEEHVRKYNRNECIVFRKTKESFGGLSNMASGYPIIINGIYIKNSEALYQACRFPHIPNIQKLILEQNSPMTAKMKSKLYRSDTRHDWEYIKLKVMRWSIEAKLLCNWDKFGRLLTLTENLPIVEESKRDSFWGASPIDASTLIGINALGRTLMDIRNRYYNFKKSNNNFKYITLQPPKVDNFNLLGKPIETLIVKFTIPSKIEECSVNANPTIFDYLK